MNIEEANKRIVEIYEGMADLQVYKNSMYGNVGSEPLGIFSKHMSPDTPAINGILQRLDDKLMRIKTAEELRPNDILDEMGYLNLLLVNMGVTKEDIAKYKD